MTKLVVFILSAILLLVSCVNAPKPLTKKNSEFYIEDYLKLSQTNTSENLKKLVEGYFTFITNLTYTTYNIHNSEVGSECGECGGQRECELNS